jgi:hypothetical protein
MTGVPHDRASIISVRRGPAINRKSNAPPVASQPHQPLGEGGGDPFGAPIESLAMPFLLALCTNSHADIAFTLT